jgi:hypothetical protein
LANTKFLLTELPRVYTMACEEFNEQSSPADAGRKGKCNN